MSVNKFGQFSDELYSRTRSPNNHVETGLKRARNGDIDACGKKIINVANPENDDNVSNKLYIDVDN